MAHLVFSSLIYLLNIGIFHSQLLVYQRVYNGVQLLKQPQTNNIDQQVRLGIGSISSCHVLCPRVLYTFRMIPIGS